MSVRYNNDVDGRRMKKRRIVAVRHDNPKVKIRVAGRAVWNRGSEHESATRMWYAGTA